MEPRDTAAVARRIVDANLYMVLATADATGRPWASPVYFANSGYDEFFPDHRVGVDPLEEDRR
jgi:Pyridoxamine 5'-phosphate oxidase